MERWPQIDLDDAAILHIDDDLIAVDKAAGMLSDASIDPKRDHLGAATARWAHASGLDGDIVPVHRLDRATSGVVLFARNKAAATAVMHQLQDRATDKRYQAIVTRPDTVWAPAAEFERRSYLRHRKGRTEEVRSGGKPAHSRFAVVSAAGPLALVDAAPLTGRTHQLRVHLAALNAPILGDDRYGGDASPRMWLHARSLTIDHPNGSGPHTIMSRVTFALGPDGPQALT